MGNIMEKIAKKKVEKAHVNRSSCCLLKTANIQDDTQKQCRATFGFSVLYKK
jgi:hypothetical protein